MTDTEMKAECFELSQEIIENVARIKDPELIWVVLDKLILNVCDSSKLRGYDLVDTYKKLKEQLETSNDQLAQDRLDRREKQGYYSKESKEKRESYEGKKVVIARWPSGHNPYAKEEKNGLKK